MISPHELPACQVTITGTPPGRIALALDGHEIRTCTKAVLALDGDGLPVLKLSLLVLSGLETDLAAHVVLDKPSALALEAMGWTPPAGKDPS